MRLTRLDSRTGNNTVVKREVAMKIDASLPYGMWMELLSLAAETH